MPTADSFRFQIARRRLVALTALAATVCLPALFAVGLLAAGRISGLGAYGVTLAGGGAAVLIAAAVCIRLREPALRWDKYYAESASSDRPSWSELANPRENHAVRWAMYDDLTAWLGQRDWQGKQVAEFGGTNDLLGAFLPGADYTLLAYPRHDAHDLRDVADDRFDLAILDQVLEHLVDPERALREVRRVLKPDGVAIVTTPFLIPVHTGPGWDDYTRWTPQGLEAVLRRCGFGASVRTWGNLEAARAVMENITISAEEAMRRGVSLTHCDGWFPITVWAIATANKDQPTTPHDRRVPDVRVRNRSTQQVEKVS